MTGNSRALFRADALQHYVAGREKAVLPRSIAPRTFLLLWVALGLLAAGAAIVAAQIPLFASGRARVTPPVGIVQPGKAAAIVPVSLPPDALASLRAGQGLVLADDASGLRLVVKSVAVDRAVDRPPAAAVRFGPGSGGARTVTQAAAVHAVPDQAVGSAVRDAGASPGVQARRIASPPSIAGAPAARRGR